MMGRTRVRGLVTVTALAAIVGTDGVALADEREQCAAAAEQAQQLRDEGKYRHAREQMLVCARDVCPGPIRSDCGKWLTELDRDAPTVVFGARDSRGADVLDVKVSMDGSPIVEKLDGKPVLVDTGEHTFTFETKDGLVKEERILVRAAEKARPIIVTLERITTSSGAGSATPPEQGGAQETRAGSLVPSLVLGGVGVLALGSFALFGISGKNDVDDLQKCKPNCAESDVDSARTKLIIADISLGAGILALAGAAILYLTRPKVSTDVQTGTSSFRFGASPVVGGGVAGIRCTF
jgi:hypothetical protein